VVGLEVGGNFPRKLDLENKNKHKSISLLALSLLDLAQVDTSGHGARVDLFLLLPSIQNTYHEFNKSKPTITIATLFFCHVWP
jgi:hypothetical protein